MGKTAIFGGTFNPVHNGHLALLRALQTLPELTEILVLPANIPPHKENSTVSKKDRFEMCRLAFSDIDCVTVSDLEYQLGGKSYTLHTLQKLRQQGVICPYLAIGGDSLRDFEQWYEYQKILQLCTLAVCKRADVNAVDFNAAYSRLTAQGAHIIVLPVQPPAISSTFIRKKAAAGESLTGLVPERVADFIAKKRLYQPPFSE